MIEAAFVACPACGEDVALEVDTTAGREQTYVEDCPVCCRPMAIRVRCRPGEVLAVQVEAG
ncbi:MAG: CPXCG motif-containing cysteine-rich protein [Vicinamibacteria bacterium]